MPEERSEKLDWHQTRAVSITTILLLLVNIVSTVWWAATLTSQVTTLSGKPDLTERVIVLEAVQRENKEWIRRVSAQVNESASLLAQVSREQSKRAIIIEQAKEFIKDKRRK